MQTRFSPSIIGLICLLLVLATQASFAQCKTCGESDTLCGPNTLLIVCEKLGVRTEIEEIKALSGFDAKTGTTMLGLQTAARAKGLHAVGMKISLEELAQSKVLAIAHQWGDHFVVVESGDTGTVEVTDPPAEPTVVPLAEFKKTYSGFALLVAKDDSLFPKPEAKGPDLRFDSYMVDFGFIEEGQQAGHTFTYENKGNEELVLSKTETSCGCVQAFMTEERHVPPGGKGELVVGFNGTGRQGGQSEAVYVYSNEPVSPVVLLQVTGFVKPVRLPISARSIYLGTVKKRNGAKQEISLRDPGDRSLAVTEVASDSSFVKVSLTRNEKPNLVYLVTAELKPGAPIGEFKGKIKVSTNYPREPVVEIPVAADVVGDIQVFPDQLFLGLVKRGQSVSKTITLSTTSEKPLVLRKIRSPFRYVAVTALPEIRGKQYTVTATLKETAPLGSVKGDVIVRTNDPDQPEIRIPVYALVEGN